MIQANQYLCSKIQQRFIKALYEFAVSDVSWKLKLIADKLDVSVDGGYNNIFQVKIFCGQKMVYELSYRGADVDVGPLLMQNLGVVCAVHQAEIEKFCPNSVAGVEAVREGREINVTVKFKNGHYLQASERELETDEFKAQCLMVFDLPPL